MDTTTKKNIDTILENVTREALMKYIPSKHRKSIKENDISLLKNKLLGDLLNEKVDTSKFPGKVETEKNFKESGKFNSEAMKLVADKMKKYLDFKNNSHPEFPHQNNSKTDYESPMYRNSTEDEEFIDDFRGMGLQDANGVEDLDRLDAYLSGSQETGNAQTDSEGNDLGNVVKSDLGKRIEKNMKRKKEKIADRKSKMSNLRGITPDVQTVTNLKESTDEEEINEFLAALARPVAAAAATYAGEKVVDKMMDEEEVDEQTGASSSGSFVAPLGWKQGELDELNIKLPLSGDISLGGDVDFSPKALSDNPGADFDYDADVDFMTDGEFGPGPNISNIKNLEGDTDPKVNIGYDSEGDEEVVDDVAVDEFLKDVEGEENTELTLAEGVKRDMTKMNHLFNYNKNTQ